MKWGTRDQKGTVFIFCWGISGIILWVTSISDGKDCGSKQHSLLADCIRPKYRNKFIQKYIKKSYVVREPLLILIEKGWMEVILIIILWCWISRHYRRGKWYRRYTGLFLGYYVLVDVFMRVWRIRSCGRTHHERCVVSEHYCRPVEAVHGICLPNGNGTFLQKTLLFTRLRLYFSRL